MVKAGEQFYVLCLSSKMSEMKQVLFSGMKILTKLSYESPETRNPWNGEIILCFPCTPSSFPSCSLFVPKSIMIQFITQGADWLLRSQGRTFIGEGSHLRPRDGAHFFLNIHIWMWYSMIMINNRSGDRSENSRTITVIALNVMLHIRCFCFALVLVVVFLFKTYGLLLAKR